MIYLHRAVLIYLLLINLAAFTAYGIDKWKAENDRWRIPEAALIMLAVLGGSPGALASMIAFHHKTRKPVFVIGIPVILLLQAAAAVAAMIITAGK